MKEEPFLEIDPNNPNMAVDYTGAVIGQFLTIEFHFLSSGRYEIDWYLNKQLIDTAKQGIKFQSNCIHYEMFKYKCLLYNSMFNSKDVGNYEAVLKLKDHKNISLTFNSIVIMPSMCILYKLNCLK